ncbi:MAG: hypothetical protein IJ149_08025 [Oscillospiraceae bacterium]|uniref:hypothetical protein n=1 Tax=Ruminococcus sp. TaxID=41978 RepID=UPI0025E89836|nr:hypothetical protein [Ruminococcus sp.]MBQ9209514.1 hypothetical protein [Oscillospiraceae bacterium]MBR1431007.1 hypothetical protein [Ruminococcus sp.]
MAKMVGINMVIKQGWMKKAVSLLSEGLSEAEYRKELEDYLSFEIDSPTNKRKAREILMRIWYLNTEGVEALQQEGRLLIQKYPQHLPEIAWCMLPLAYPIFFDYADLIGKMLSFETEVSTGQIKQKMFDEIGERHVIDTATSKIISTMRELGAISSQKVGKHSLIHTDVTNTEIISFMVRTAMYLDGSSYYSLSALEEFKALFPYKYHISKEHLVQDDRFVLSTFDGELTVSLNSGT